jgi:hypothetical protein
MDEFEIDKEGFNEKELDECILLQHKILKLIKENKKHVVFSVLLGLAIKPMLVGGTKKKHAIKIIDEAWDVYAKEYGRLEMEEKQ